MANEFKIKKGLIVTGASGGTVVDIQGSQGQLFSVTDDLSGSIFAVSDISGVPILDVNSSGLSTFDGDVNLPDNKKILLGTGNDLELYHDASHSYIKDIGVGDLKISSNTVRIESNASENMIIAIANGGVSSYYNNVKKFETTSSGVSVSGGLTVSGTNSFLIESNNTAATFNLNSSARGFDFINNNGTLLNLDSAGNGTFADQAFATTATSSGDASSTLTTKGYVDGLITGATIYRGAWDPSGGGYGSPDLSGVTQTSGYYYICSAAGTAEPNGTGTEPDTWETGDWVIYNDVSGTGQWQKIDNSSVLSGVGTGQTVALWEGAGSVTDSETLGNAPITVSGNNATFAGNVTLSGQAAPQLFLTSNTTGTPNYTLIANASSQFIIGRAGVSNDFILNSGNATFAGNVDVNGTEITVGTNGSIFAENNLRFKSSGAAYIDHNTVGQSINFRTSVSSSLDTTPLSLTGANATFAGNVDAAGNVEARGYLQAFSTLYMRGTTQIMNKNADGFLNFFERDTSGSETKMNISNVGTLSTSGDATFAGTVSSGRITVSSDAAGDSSWDDSGILIENTSTTTGEPTLAFRNAGTNGTGSNYWFTGLNQSSIYKIAYGTSFTDGNTKLELASNGALRLNTYTQGFLQTDANGNISTSGGGTLPGGPYLPLTGGTLSGNLTITKSSATMKVSEAGGGDIRMVAGGATGYIGTYNNTSMQIMQNGGNAIFIDTSKNVGIGTTTPNYKLTVSGGINAGGVVTYSKVDSSLNTTGYAIAGLGTVFNGASAFFTFTASGGTGQYQRVVYSCAGVGTNWAVYKVIDEGTNVLDIEASATSAATIVFTFKTRSGTQAYSPRVVIQASGHSIISTYA
jgi:hypothetical protein